MQLSNIKALKDVSIHVGSVFKMTFYPQDGVSLKEITLLEGISILL